MHKTSRMLIFAQNFSTGLLTVKVCVLFLILEPSSARSLTESNFDYKYAHFAFFFPQMRDGLPQEAVKLCRYTPVCTTAV